MNEWDKRYQELVDFRNRNGHTNVPLQVSSNGRYSDGLGEWVSLQRYLFCNQHTNSCQSGTKEDGVNRISREKVMLLEALNIDCSPCNHNDNCSQKALILSSQQGQNQQRVDVPSTCGIEGHSSSHQENSSATADNDKKSSHELMDIADAYTIRAVLHSHERKRAHNELMHSSLKALFAEKIRTGSLFDNNAFVKDDNGDDSSKNNSSKQG